MAVGCLVLELPGADGAEGVESGRHVGPFPSEIAGWQSRLYPGPKEAPMTKQESRPAELFEETGIGAVVMLSIMFLSPTLLIGGLALVGIAKLVSRRWARTE